MAASAAATLVLPFLIASPATAASTTEVTFPDRALDRCVASALGLGQNDPITVEQAATLKQLTCNENEVESLEGIGALSNLSDLNLLKAPLSGGLGPLAELSGLRKLSVSDAQSLDIAPLADLESLTELSVQRTQVADLTPLSAMTQLTSLSLNRVQNGNITPLQNLVNLTSLQLNASEVTDLRPLKGLTKMQFFEATSNQIGDVSPLSGWTSLRHLNMHTNNIADVTPLRGLVQLRTVNLQSNGISDVSSWSNLTRVTDIALDNNKIAELDSFIPMSGLETLTVSRNLVEDVAPLHDLVFIDHLDLSRNRIVSIEPIKTLEAPNYVVLNGQDITLPEIVVGQPQPNPVRTLDGSPLPVTSRTADYDPNAVSWTFAAVGNNTLNWESPDLGIGSYSVFSGSISQKSVAESAVLELTKTSRLQEANGIPRAGDKVAYRFEITNAGNTTVTEAEIVDNMPDLSILSYSWPGAARVLEPGQTAAATATYTLKQSDIDAGRITNTALATAKSVAGTPIASEPASTDLVLEQAAVLSLTKEADVSSVASPARPGDNIEYAFVIENTGNVSISGSWIQDELPNLSEVSITWPDAEGHLLPGQTASGSATYSITQEDIDEGSVQNKALAHGTDPNGGDVVSDEAVAKTKLDSVPLLRLSKTADASALQSPTQIGDEIHYEITATNTGTQTLTEVAITDELPGLTELTFTWPGAVGVLAPGESVRVVTTYAVQATDFVSYTVINSAAAVATSSDGTALRETASVSTVLEHVETQPVTGPSHPGAPALALTGASPLLPLAAAAVLLMLGLFLWRRTPARHLPTE
ncbi:putative repeat protein (TIGR01451 family) [Microbacterium natoriense]|uniref:Repeat protein (TIGR01451 family) n=1 Tax=Microbacterium natoriense TaxID=284570 RepID=A0AAW8EUZ2_9MICO|nr:hypothetical protein [Microbacterium natoriense]MDQ0647260.1 putative repeat protein (TIGR01451 family) [Microbacterium natoriense]